MPAVLFLHSHRDCWLLMLSFASYADWFAVRLTCRAGRDLTSVSHKLYAWQRPRDWVVQQLQARGFPAERMCDLLIRDRHFIGGSFVLWCLLTPSAWLPHDVDIFALTSWSCHADGKPTQQEFFHYTPFVHDAFAFTRAFYPDEEFAALSTDAHDQLRASGLSERLIEIKSRDGYELFPVYARGYLMALPRQADEVDADDTANAADTVVDATYHTHRSSHPAGAHADAALAQAQAQAHAPAPEFDYVMVQSGLGPETHHWFTPLPTAQVRIILEYFGHARGFTSVPAALSGVGDMAFCAVLFDGRRFRVADWEAVWTRQAHVHVDQMAQHIEHPRDTYSLQKLWSRTMQRVRKYQRRGFAVDLHGDSTPLFRHCTGVWGFPVQPLRRRHSCVRATPAFWETYREDTKYSQQGMWPSSSSPTVQWPLALSKRRRPCPRAAWHQVAQRLHQPSLLRTKRVPSRCASSSSDFIRTYSQSAPSTPRATHENDPAFFRVHSPVRRRQTRRPDRAPSH